MDILCTADMCPVILNSTCVFYEGNTLMYTGITTNDSIQTALQKIDAKFGDAHIGYTFTNGVYQSAAGAPVGLGGNLTTDISIGGNYTLTFTGNVRAAKHITTGGNASQFVKGDGTLDGTAYQAAGNYITALTGDVIAAGPGSVGASLAVVNSNPGTYGTGSLIPVVTVDTKGRVTALTTTAINVPSGILSFVGDVYGSGVTGSQTTLTLSDVNTNVYTVNSFLKFKVNAKGQVTSAAPITHVDIEAVLGYVPTPETRKLSINGVQHDLQSDIYWEIATGVSNVTASAPLSSTGGATPNISITKADASTDGYLDNVDWVTFNSKQAALNGTGLVRMSGTTVTYDNTAYTPQSRTLTINGTTYDLSANRSWSIDSMIYPAAGIAVSTGTAWGTSIVDNSTNWNTAYSQRISSSSAPLSILSNNISIAQATGASDGYLSATDWNTFNNKQPAGSYVTTSRTISTTGPLQGGGDLSADRTLSITQAGASTDGYLSSTDWNTFNNKQAAGDYITALTGEATATGPGSVAITLSTPAVTGKLLTGVNITGGSVVATDTILEAFGKVQNQINGLVGGSIYKGVWNASTNTPTLTSGVGTTGWYYIVNVAGTTNLDGITDWHLGDWAIFDGTAWQQVDNTDAVVSVNGYTGAVSLVSSDVPEGLTNLYYTPARARTAISLTTTGTSGAATYDNITGVLNVPVYTPDLSGYVPTTRTLTINGTGYDLSADRSWTVSGTMPAGGTAGQILSKIDATDYNTQWIDNFASQVKNVVKLGAALAKGTPVYVSGADGTNMIVSASSNTTEAGSSKTFGLLETGGALNDQVECVTYGLIAGLDTSAANAAGDPVWLGPNGTLLYGLANKPVAPAHMVYIGVVTRKQSNNGEIFVNIQNGFEVDELHDVLITAPKTDGQGLFLQTVSGTQLWRNRSIADVLGYTPANDANVVKLTGNQTVAGIKTFTTGIIADVTTGGTQGFASTNSSDSGSSIFLQNNSTVIGNAIGISNLYTADGISIGNDTSGRGIYISNATVSGSGKGISIDNYNGGIGIEVGSDSTADAIKILHLSGRGLNIQSSGAGYGLIINNTTASTSAPFTIQKQGATKISFTDAGAATFSSTVTATSLVKSGGTSSQYLMADGSVSTGSFGDYLPLSGGTMTGNITYSPGDATDWYLKGPANGPTIRMRYSGGTTNRNAALGWMNNTPTYSDILYWTDSVVNSLVALQQGGNQVLHAGNYSSYALPLSGGTLSGIQYSTYNTATGRANLGFNTAKTVIGNYHIQNGSGPGNDNSNQAAITFQGGTSSEAQAGIYVLNNGSYGTSMGFATTNSYATGPQLFMTATNGGLVDFPRAAPTVQGNTVLHAGNYSSYALPLSGGTLTGKLQINANWAGTNPERFTIRGTYPSITLRSTNSDNNWLMHNEGSLAFYYAAGVDSDSWGRRLTLDTSGVLTTGLLIAQGPGGNYNENIRLPGSTAVISFNTSGATGAGSYNIVSQTNFQIRSSTGAQVFVMDQSGNLTMTGTVTAPTFSGTATNSSQLNGISSTQLFNNMGNNHTTYQDFNSVGNFGVRYVQGSTNAPQSGQFYGFTLGLGNDYTVNQYGSQFYWMRNTSTPYVWIRYLENGSWGSWNKISAGYADAAANSDSLGGYGSSTYLGKFGNGNGYYQANNWIQINANTGLYWPSYYGLHIYPNNDGSYGSMQVSGVKNSWSGIYFTNSANTLMMNGNESGHYVQGYGWQIRWYQGTLYNSRSTYGGGTEYTVWDSGNLTNLNQLSNGPGYITSASNVYGLYNNGFGSGNLTWYQTSGGLQQYTGSWASFIISNHGDGATYYNQTIIMPFWGVPQYMRKEGGTNRGPYTFYTTENLNPNSISGNFTASGNITAGGYFYSGSWLYSQGNAGWHNDSYNQGLRQAKVNATYGNVITEGENYNGWSGYNTSNTYLTCFMQNAAGDHGFYQEGGGSGWTFFYHHGYNCGGIGTDATDPSYSLHIVKYGGSNTGWIIWSDRRIKENIQTIDNALDKVLSLRGVYYNKIDDPNKERCVGYIAQEVMEVVPELVVYSEELDIYNMNYGPMVGMLTEAIKEHHAKTVAQQAEIDTLKEQVQTLLNYINNGV